MSRMSILIVAALLTACGSADRTLLEGAPDFYEARAATVPADVPDAAPVPPSAPTGTGGALRVVSGPPAPSGAVTGSGGAPSGAGGAPAASGGTTAASGGTTAATGGAPAGSGGAPMTQAECTATCACPTGYVAGPHVGRCDCFARSVFTTPISVPCGTTSVGGATGSGGAPGAGGSTAVDAGAPAVCPSCGCSTGYEAKTIDGLCTCVSLTGAGTEACS